MNEGKNGIMEVADLLITRLRLWTPRSMIPAQNIGSLADPCLERDVPYSYNVFLGLTRFQTLNTRLADRVHSLNWCTNVQPLGHTRPISSSPITP